MLLFYCILRNFKVVKARVVIKKNCLGVSEATVKSKFVLV